MSIKHKTKLILSTFILSLYVAFYVIERLGYFDRLSPMGALATGFALAFVGGIVVGVTVFYLWTCRKARRGGVAKLEEHAV